MKNASETYTFQLELDVKMRHTRGLSVQADIQNKMVKNKYQVLNLASIADLPSQVFGLVVSFSKDFK